MELLSHYYPSSLHICSQCAPVSYYNLQGVPDTKKARLQNSVSSDEEQQARDPGKIE